MKSPVAKRSIIIAGRRTSVSLEDAFWKGEEIAGAPDPIGLGRAIDSARQQGNLSSALRLFVLGHYHSQIGAQASTKSAGEQRESAG